jgi:hypothetical protein
MADINSPDNDNIRRQQESDLGHKLDHAPDKTHGPPAELLKPVKLPGNRNYLEPQKKPGDAPEEK